MAQEMSEEQLAALQEKIKNMSPEELKEFQKKQCIFCQIIAGKIQAKKIYEDEKVLGVLDINPANPGHILLLPKEHYAIMPQMPEEEISHIFMSAKHISNAMLRSIEAQGTNIIVANGVAAGQRAQHFMVHIIPRKENDGIQFTLPQKTMPESDIESVGNLITASLAGQPEENQAKGLEQKKEPQSNEKIIHGQQKNSNPGENHNDKKIHNEKLTNKDEEGIKNKGLQEQSNHEKKHDDKGKTAEPKSGIDLDDIAKLLGVK